MKPTASFATIVADRYGASMATPTAQELLKALANIRRIATTGPTNLPLTIDEAVREWESKKRRMGCIAASQWFCARVEGFWLEDLDRYTASGDYFGHTVATDGLVRIDLSPYADAPRDD